MDFTKKWSWAAVVVFLISAAIFTFGLPRAINLYVVDAIFALVAWFATIAAYVTMRAFRRNDSLKGVWAVLTAGLALWALGETSWFIIEAILGLDPYPSIADLFWVLGYPIVFVGLVLGMKTLHVRPSSGGKIIGTALILIIAFDLWYFVLSVILPAKAPLIQKFLNIYYPVGDLILLSPVIYSLMTLKYRAVDYSWKLIALGLGLIMVNDVIFSYLAIIDVYQSGSLLDSFWIGGYLIIGLGSIFQLDKIDRSRQEEQAQAA